MKSPLFEEFKSVVSCFPEISGESWRKE